MKKQKWWYPHTLLSLKFVDPWKAKYKQPHTSYICSSINKHRQTKDIKSKIVSTKKYGFMCLETCWKIVLLRKQILNALQKKANESYY